MASAGGTEASLRRDSDQRICPKEIAFHMDFSIKSSQDTWGNFGCLGQYHLLKGSQESLNIVKEQTADFFGVVRLSGADDDGFSKSLSLPLGEF